MIRAEPTKHPTSVNTANTAFDFIVAPNGPRAGATARDRCRSFAPDVAFVIERPPRDQFITGAPIFAGEVRSKDDYGRAAERAMAAKRGEYFAAGTLVVWDVDVLKEHVIRVYRAAAPSTPTIY